MQYKHLLNRAVRRLLDMVLRVMPGLRADPRLAQVAALLGAAQADLESADSAETSAVAAVREAEAVRDEGRRNFEDVVREFGVVLLSSGRGRHDRQPYVLYYPEGYGELRLMTARQLIQHAGRAVTMLEAETDPRLVPYHDRIRDTCAGFTALEDRYEEAVRAQEDAHAFLFTGRRRFVRAVSRARSLALSLCDDEPEYIMGIFAPFRLKRRALQGDATEGTSEGSESAQAPVPQGPVVVGVPEATGEERAA